MPVASPHPSDDTSSLADVRFIGDVAGCYTLSSREQAGSDRARVFACRARSISPRHAVVTAPVNGQKGERVALRFDGLGLVSGDITRLTPDGFVADLRMTDDERRAFATRVNWLKRRHLEALVDRRSHKRWLPREPKTTLTLAGGRTLECFIINISESGVAVSADLMPQPGLPLAIGAVLGRVVRRLELGFAVRFASPQNLATVESLLGSVAPSRRDALGRALAAAEAQASLLPRQ